MPISSLESSDVGPLGIDPLRSVAAPKKQEKDEKKDGPVTASFAPPLRPPAASGPLAADVAVVLPASRAGADPLSALKQKRAVEQHERDVLRERPSVVDTTTGLAALGPCPVREDELLRPSRHAPEERDAPNTSEPIEPIRLRADTETASLNASDDMTEASTASTEDTSALVMKLQDFLGDLGDETCFRLSKENADELMQALSQRGPASGLQERNRWSEHCFEVEEHEILEIGPFEPGRKCEIVSASFGPRDGDQKHVDVTDAVRRRWSDEKGVQIEDVRSLLDRSDAEVISSISKGGNVLSVKCRMSVPGHDVSTGKYSEGIGRVARTVPLVTKALANVVGATLAASGYAMAKVQTSMGPEKDGSVADSEIFQWGFASWLRLNGVKPSVSYDQPGNAGIRLRWLHSQSYPTMEVPRQMPPADDVKQTAILVSNHISYIDAMVLASVFGAPKVLAKAGTLQVPLLGRFAKEIGCIEVDRSNRNSRAATLDSICEHSDAWRPGDRPLLLFPEGTTSNGAALLEFKKGAFTPGVPVRPVVICYTGNWHPANVNFKVSQKGEIRQTSDAEWGEQFLNHLIHSLEVRVLPPYIPNEEEKKDAGLYASSVRNVMSEVYLQMYEAAEASREARARSKPVASFLKRMSRIP